ncbi:putative phosphodiesterase [Catenulispora sp. GP43]|uniref:metallophosphoesterase family protein n=1 Tax=Catenulispora sp. GP43 TaxID=3156263 RepID=UPI003514AEB3
MSSEFYGPASWEGQAKRYGPVDRVAVLSDVHANVPALRAVLAEPEVAAASLVVFNGDLTWGVDPDGTVAIVKALGPRAVCVRGNSERYVRQITTGAHTPANPRQQWVPAQHGTGALAFVGSFPFSVVVDVRGLGPVRFCHGSPRSDHEAVTPGTSEQRFAEMTAGIEEDVLVTGHTHLQFDRFVGTRRSVNPGSVGLPYHRGEPGVAHWALLGPDVQLRTTRYDVRESVAASVAAGDPGHARIAELLLTPPTPEEIIAEAEQLVLVD